MWQYSPALARSALKWPGWHSHIPILQCPSAEVQSIEDASCWPILRAVGLSLKSSNANSASSLKTLYLSSNYSPTILSFKITLLLAILQVRRSMEIFPEMARKNALFSAYLIKGHL